MTRHAILVCGPFGAGKSTYIKHHLSDLGGYTHHSKDVVAKHMFPDYAGQVHYAEAAQGPHQDQLMASIKAGENILYETTGSRPDVLDMMKLLKEHDYRVTLIRVDLASETLSKLRISQRAKTGGSNVAAERISARWPRGIENFVTLAAQADETYIYDNSGDQMVLTAEIKDQSLDVMIPDKLPHIIEALRAGSFKEKHLARY